MHTSDRLSLPGDQHVLRKDRHNGTEGYGVVLTMVVNYLACKPRHDLESIDLEAMWLEIHINNNKFMLCVVYRPPNSRLIFWEQLQASVDYVLSKGIKKSW